MSEHIMGPVVELAAKVKAALDGKGKTLVETNYGNFYVAAVELVYSGPGVDREVVGYLRPDEGEGDTLDLHIPDVEPVAYAPVTPKEVTEDWRELDEDVSQHTMGEFHTHDDQRTCGWHHRLRKWTFGGNKECLRNHPYESPKGNR